VAEVGVVIQIQQIPQITMEVMEGLVEVEA
jgi:hypothetical protein